MLKKFLVATATAAAVLSFSACGYDANGVITSKHHEEAYSMPMMQPYPCGINITCYNVVTQYYPDEYSFKINGKDCYVEADIYANYSQGDTYNGHCE